MYIIVFMIVNLFDIFFCVCHLALCTIWNALPAGEITTFIGSYTNQDDCGLAPVGNCYVFDSWLYMPRKFSDLECNITLPNEGGVYDLCVGIYKGEGVYLDKKVENVTYGFGTMFPEFVNSASVTGIVMFVAGNSIV